MSTGWKRSSLGSRSTRSKATASPGVYKPPGLPGLELRLGGYKNDADRTVKQIQSAAPPTVGTDGKPRVWTGDRDIAWAPEGFYQVLAALQRPIKPTKDAPTASPHEPKTSVLSRASAYLAKCEPAVSGQRGHDKAFKAACAIGLGFDLAQADTLRLLREEYNPRCDPPWSDAELIHKG